MKKLTLLLLFIAHLSLGQNSITKWSGILNSGGRKVEMILNMLPDTNGTFKSSWDIPAQKCKACTVAEYGDLETTIEPEVLSYLQTWLENEKLSNFKAK